VQLSAGTARRPSGRRASFSPAARPAGGEALRVTELTKWYGSVHALDGVGLTVKYGEVVALVGDNGAGKSSLINCIGGVVQPDEGEIHIDGRSATLKSAREASDLGICTVHQDSSLADNLSAVENLFLGRELTRGFGPFRRVDSAEMRRRTEETIAGLGISTIADVSTQVGQLSGGQRQSVAVGRTMLDEFGIVLLDEPTTGLSVGACARVMGTVRALRARGAAVLIVSQNIDEVFDVADRIVVLHLGRLTAQFRRADVTPEDVVAAVMGMTLR
jgi:ABC-type sugar transport system ATPase subunit